MVTDIMTGRTAGLSTIKKAEIIKVYKECTRTQGTSLKHLVCGTQHQVDEFFLVLNLTDRQSASQIKALSQ